MQVRGDAGAREGGAQRRRLPARARARRGRPRTLDPGRRAERDQLPDPDEDEEQSKAVLRVRRTQLGEHLMLRSTALGS